MSQSSRARQIDKDAPRRASEAELAERVGSRIGPYRLLEKIGEGGMGVVYMAEQEQPVRRRVALKVIKLGMDTRQVVARFEAERQALALMDHPNISRVLDAGATEGGRPYFVMELVRGSPITEYCDKHKLPMKERLRLFISVCHAVQHAHHKGIIHRDLKPGNILVTIGADGRPFPKVIDFGIAKAIHHRLTERTLFTEHRQLIGTPQYMSPEQAEADAVDVDTRTDVYSLGVLLYELLTGSTPLDVRELAMLALDRIQEVIREREPPRPSTRLSTLGDAATAVAARRGVAPAELSRLLEGDLDWVVMRALEKDRTRRYETAVALAKDIERYLADEPVEACPPSRAYRLRKAMRKNRTLILTATAFALVLIAGTAISIRQAIRATDARNLAIRREIEATEAAEVARIAREAETAAKKEAEASAIQAAQAGADTQAFARFLSDHVLAASRPEGLMGGVGANVTLAEALAKAEDSIGQVFAGRPRAEALARHEVGVTWRNLGRYTEAERHLRRALELRASLLGADDPETFETRSELATCHALRKEWPQAETLDRQSVEQARRIFGPSDTRYLAALSKLGLDLLGQEKWKEAEDVLRECVDARRELEPEIWTTYNAISCLGGALLGQGKLKEAAPLLREGYEGLKEREDGSNPNYVLRLREALERLVKHSEVAGKPREAARWRDALEKVQATPGQIVDHS